MTSKQLSDLCKLALIGLIMVQSNLGAHRHNEPCSSAFGYEYRCVKPKNCDRQGSIHPCGPYGIGVCCKVISHLSSPKCGIRRLIRRSKRPKKVNYRANEKFDQESYELDEDQSDMGFSQTSDSFDNEELKTSSSGVSESRRKRRNPKDSSSSSESTINPITDTTQDYGDKGSKSTENVSSTSEISDPTRDSAHYNHETTVTIDSKTVSDSDETSENILETIIHDTDITDPDVESSEGEIQSTDSEGRTATIPKDNSNENINLTGSEFTTSEITSTTAIHSKTIATNSENTSTTAIHSENTSTDSATHSKTTSTDSAVTSSVTEINTKAAIVKFEHRQEFDFDADSSEESQETNTTGDSHGRESVALHIVGGIRETASWPWIVAIYLMPGLNFVCSGTLIDNQHILSAAHCFQSQKVKNPAKLTVVIGHLRRVDKSDSSEGVVFHQVSELIVHQEFSFTCYCSDIAILRLKQKLGNDHTPACINDVEPSSVGQTVTVIGWGDLEYVPKGSKADRGSYHLQRADGLVIIPASECSEIMSKVAKQQMPSDFGEYYICAGVPDGSKDACVGDSGGPLMFEDYDGYWTVIGVVSFGYKCATPGVPGTYSKISYFIPWISNVLSSR